MSVVSTEHQLTKESLFEENIKTVDSTNVDLTIETEFDNRRQNVAAMDVTNRSISDTFLDRVDDEVLETVAVANIRSESRFDYSQ